MPKKSNFFAYQVKVNGEIWKAISKEELTLKDSIIVEDKVINELVLKIKKVSSMFQ